MLALPKHNEMALVTKLMGKYVEEDPVFATYFIDRANLAFHLCQHYYDRTVDLFTIIDVVSKQFERFDVSTFRKRDKRMIGKGSSELSPELSAALNEVLQEHSSHYSIMIASGWAVLNEAFRHQSFETAEEAINAGHVWFDQMAQDKTGLVISRNWRGFIDSKGGVGTLIMHHDGATYRDCLKAVFIVEPAPTGWLQNKIVG